ncbi:hypothetical protein INT43_005221 [Umbelopsis isabellina]|uniref:ABC transporter domain-containing protein n=1 Tax=Mortierella isabellina TaxID=91625 RepID=A0A8H7PGZ4_MORIS|nr:hypothetical protein INT43_005221 [Umbelopsis isabellina]
MAQALSVLSSKRRTLGPLVLLLFFALYKNKTTITNFVQSTLKDPNAQQTASSKHKQKQARKKVGVNATFFRQMAKMLPICIPSVASRETGLLTALAVVLIARTWLDIWFSAFNGQVVKAIVSRNREAFISKAIFEFGLMMWPMSIVNNCLKLTISALALCFRERLTNHAHNQYLNGITFYKIANLDNRLQNADQLLTQDIDKFSENLSHLYSDIAKPLVDICLFAYKLGEAIGGEAPVFMIAYFVMSGIVLRAFSPPFGKYTAIEQKLEGDFRFTHSRIIAHSEEIAFYGGGNREREVVDSSFRKVIINIKTYPKSVHSEICQWHIRLCPCKILRNHDCLLSPDDPFEFHANSAHSLKATHHMGEANTDPAKLMEDYSRNSSYLVNLSQAVGRLILTGRDLTRFAGYTSRVSELFDVMRDVGDGKYSRTMVNPEKGAANINESIDTTHMKGRIIIQDGVINFNRVPIVTPNKDILLKELSFRVETGMNCLISGPNGCGKSSLFRILGDLWPLWGGTVTKPAASQLFYVPQKPYLPLGTFRDQIIYPDSREDALKKGYDDEQLMGLLKVVHLGYLVDREGGWSAVQDWAEVLSGGEKQRVAMARLFYHKPQFAILDECTSAVSIDVEAIMYQYARKAGITLFTVSHRTSLLRHHEYLLRFDGEGHYEFRELDPEDTNTAFGFGHGKTQTSDKYEE